MSVPNKIDRHDFQIGNLTVVPTRDIVIKGNQRYALEPLVMDVLCVLAEQPGEVFMREDIIERIWDENHGGDESLTRAVSLLRKTLREADTEQDYVETIPKRGYRLTQNITNGSTANATLKPAASTLARNSGSVLPILMLGLLGVLTLTVLIAIAA